VAKLPGNIYSFFFGDKTKNDTLINYTNKDLKSLEQKRKNLTDANFNYDECVKEKLISKYIMGDRTGEAIKDIKTKYGFGSSFTEKLSVNVYDQKEWGDFINYTRAKNYLINLYWAMYGNWDKMYKDNNFELDIYGPETLKQKITCVKNK
jgi:hypothetical protein